jgi:mRNA-degrading endonuclease toxin of MazEF toxin-antitoxin module
MPGDRNVNGPRPAILLQRPTLKYELRGATRITGPNPNVQRPMPIAIAVNIGSRFGSAKQHAISVAQIEALRTIIRAHG